MDNYLFAVVCILLGAGVIIGLKAAEKRKKERLEQEKQGRLEQQRMREEEQKRRERLEQMTKKTREEAFGKLEAEYARRVEAEKKSQASPGESGKVRPEAAERSMGLVENLQLTFGDLRIDGQETEHAADRYDADKLAEYAEAFFGAYPVRSTSGEPLSMDAKIRVIRQFMQYAACWVDHLPADGNGYISCRPGTIENIWTSEEEEHCLDGGNYATYTVRSEKCLRLNWWIGLDEGDWQLYAHRWKTDTAFRITDRNCSLEKVYEDWKSWWGYTQEMGNERVPAMIISVNDGSELMLLNPFGVKGIFSFTVIYR